MTALEYLLEIHELGSCGFWSKENPNIPASRSEIRRWLANGVLHINGKAVKADDIIDYEIKTVVLFPKNALKRVTLK
jgi:hypothetical protein